MGEVIAKKTNREGYINIIVFCIMITLFIKNEGDDILFFIFGSLVPLFYTIRCFLSPKILIYKESNTLIIYPNGYNEQTITLDNISSVSYQRIENNHNSIIVNLKDKGIKIDNIRNKKQVVEKINLILKNYKNSIIY